MIKHIDKKTSLIISILIPVLIVAWNLGFDLGAFDTVLYRNLMNAWVFATATLIILLYLKWRHKAAIKNYWLIIIFIPILWPLIDYFDQRVDNNSYHFFVIIFYLMMAICLSFTLYFFLKLIKYDIFEPLTRRHFLFVVLTVFGVGFTGYQVGLHHYLFLACGHFRISGEYIPENCYKHPNHNFRTFYRKAW